MAELSRLGPLLYKPLPVTVQVGLGDDEHRWNAIRLLRILLNTDDTVVECILRVVILEAALSYEALSYVWSKAVRLDYIVYNGYRKPVTSNLGAALKTFEIPR
jgi:hypothetical protein